MRRWIVLVCACGRLNFDPLGEGSASGDGAAGGDTLGVDSVAISGDSCANPRDIVIGQVFSSETLAGANDDYPGLCQVGPDVVYRFTQTSGARQIDLLADFNGYVYIQTAGTGCPPTTGGCQSFVANTQYTGSPTISAGTRHILVEKTGGTGTSFSISVQ